MRVEERVQRTSASKEERVEERVEKKRVENECE